MNSFAVFLMTVLLKETLSKTITVDDFTGKLFEIHQKIIDEGGSAQVSTMKVQLY